MPFKSPYPHLDIPRTDILTYLFPPNTTPSDTPLWLDSSNPRHSLSPRQLLLWVKRLAVGLDKIGVKSGEVVMIHTPNHIFVPVAYLGIVGSGRVFSGANPVYTASGKDRAWKHAVKLSGVSNCLKLDEYPANVPNQKWCIK